MAPAQTTRDRIDRVLERRANNAKQNGDSAARNVAMRALRQFRDGENPFPTLETVAAYSLAATASTEARVIIALLKYILRTAPKVEGTTNA